MALDHIESVSPPLDLSEFDAVIDVRSPSEFEEDHLPEALNLPVLDDRQRSEIGALFREDPFAARRAGAACISAATAAHLAGDLATRPRRWQPLVYCWRGGMRSRAFAFILRSVGWRARILHGGYKSWRRFMIAELDRLFSRPGFRFEILAGLTGAGKTRLLAALHAAGAQVLDLEALAAHRGSLLGQAGKQPSQKRFESLIYQTVAPFDPASPVFIEAESNRIGRLSVPPALWQRLHQGVVTELVLPLAERVRVLLEDYPHFPAQPARLAELLDQLRPLRGHASVDAWQEQISRRDWPSFVRSILEQHYDPAYRKPGAGKSVYPHPSRTLSLPDASPPTLDQTAARLMEEARAAPRH